jgi:hypothetical protein
MLCVLSPGCITSVPPVGCASAAHTAICARFRSTRASLPSAQENYLQGRTRALWFSVSGDLVADARRDIEVRARHGIEISALEGQAKG